MNFRVRNIDFNYNQDGMIQDVMVRFDTHNQEEGTNLNGSIKMTKEEYLENSSNLNNLAAVVKTKLKESVAAM